jgi:hypothetical protein
MPEEYGAGEYSENVYGGDLRPVITTDFIEYFPEILPRALTTIFRKYVDAHGLEYDGFDAATRYVKLSRQVENADGDDLERIGALFGQLGARRGRADSEYRSYLSSLVQTFAARGSVSGVRFAIAAALNTSEENVNIIEDFERNEYEIEIEGVQADFLSGVINELAQLSDPSGIELAAPPVIITAGDELLIDRTNASVIDTVIGLGADTLTIDGNSTIGGFTETTNGDSVP